MPPLVEREGLRSRSSKTQRYRETDWVSERENEFQREEMLLQYTGLTPWHKLTLVSATRLLEVSATRLWDLLELWTV